MLKNKGILFIALLSFLSTSLFSQGLVIEPFKIQSSELEMSGLGEYLYIMQDSSASMSFEEAMISNGYIKADKSVPNLGITESAFWIKFAVQNNSDNDVFLLQLAQPLIDEVSFYNQVEGGVELLEYGEVVPFSVRKYNYPSYVFDLDIPPGETKTYVLRVRAKEQLHVPLYIGNTSNIIKDLTTKQFIYSTFFGIIFVMLLYNLFVYFAVRGKNYLLYILYIITVGLAQLLAQGFTFQYLWPDNAWLATHTYFLLPPLSGHAVIQFARNYMQIKTYAPKLNKALSFLHIIYAIAIVLGLLDQFALSTNINNLAAMLAIILMMSSAVIITRKKYRPAMFFLTAWSIFLIGVIFYILKDAGVLPFNNFTNYMMLAGVALETVLLSFGLADQINIMRQEKEESQARALAALRENEKIVKEQNIILEQKVDERTMELQQSNEALGSTLSNLKETQSQLVDAEKMASLGQLTAGIAHEINNPINFVTSNISPLKRDLTEIYEIVESYSTVKVENANKSLENAHQLREDYDFDYLKEEIDTLVNGISDGAFRTQEIVKGLRTFSRLDEDDIKLASVSEGMESTLVILQSKTKDIIKMERDYEEDVPLIECYPGKLNQVFMNILNNAIYAVMNKKYEGGEKPTITLKSRKGDNEVKMHLMDNGIGMDEITKKKLFEPFYTTKDVGEGTGLGMSIVFTIIEKHHGKIHINSEVGKGSEFIITLPLRQPKDSE